MHSHPRVCGIRVLLSMAVMVVPLGRAWGQQDEAAPHHATGDLYQVPTGDARELLEFIGRLVDTTPPEGVDEREHALKTCRALVKASDRILAGDVTVSQANDAVAFKVEGLTVLEFLGEQDSLQQLEAFLVDMAGDERAEIASSAQEKLVEFRLSQMGRGQLSGKKLDAVVDEIVEWMLAAEFDRGRLRRLVRMVELVEALGGNEAAISALEQVLPHAERSTKPVVAANLDMVRGIQRRLRLPGNKLELDGKLLDGSVLDWSQYQGKVVLVDFWASWCQFCLEEIPNIKLNYATFRERGFEVIGVCLDEDRNVALETVERMDIQWPTIFSDDENATGWDSPIALKYGISQLPMAILIDADGRVVDMVARGERLGEQLEKLLKQPRPARSALAP